MKKALLISVIFLSSVAASAFADIYKYIDENGVIHFTNTPGVKGYKKVISEKSKPSEKDYDHIIHRMSDKYNIEPEVIKAVITAESNWNAKAVSEKGAMGLMQLMPSTARELQINNPFDPEQNIEGGTRYLRLLLNRFNGNLKFAVAAYNAGPSTVESEGGIPSFYETKKFLKKVLSTYKKEDYKKAARIYKVSNDNGTILYTNIPYSDKLSIFPNF